MSDYLSRFGHGLAARDPRAQALIPNRPTVRYDFGNGVELVYYVDELEQLRLDAQLYGNVFVKADEIGVYARVDPRSIDDACERSEP